MANKSTHSGPKQSAADVSIGGVDPRARDVAKDLARRSGMTLGEWLNRVILEEHATPEEPERTAKVVRYSAVSLPAQREASAPFAAHISAMRAAIEAVAPWRDVSAFLGGPSVLRRPVESALDAHDLLATGIPARALTSLVEQVALLQEAANFERALGMSQRTLQRRRDEPDRPLSVEQSGRTWKFAEILAKAVMVFGSQEDAEAWLQRPAVGLNQRSPLELLSTAAGVEAVEEHLGRLEHGVYA